MSAVSHTEQQSRKPQLGDLFKRLGPGIITGAADDDPSGIATYSHAGAQFGPNMLWTVVLTLPLMAAVMQVASRESVMGPFTATRGQRVLGWPTTAVMAVASVAMFLTM